MSIIAETLFLQEIRHLDWKSGVTKHDQTYKAFLAAARIGLTPDLALSLVVDQIQRSGGVLNERDVLRQRSRAYEFVEGSRSTAAGLPAGLVLGPEGAFRSRPILPEFSPSKLKSLSGRIETAVDPHYLRERSRVWPETWWEYLAAIYRPEDRILVSTKFDSRHPFLLWPAADRMSPAPSSEEGAWYLCNPVDGQMHSVARCRSTFNPEGYTCRSQECVTSFRYMVLESDHKDEDHPGVSQDWLKLMVLLPLRIVAIHTSAGKSTHALVRLDASSKEDWDEQVRKMKPFLVEHGADNGALRAVQLTRLPYAYRGSRRQELLYCNPAADGTPICELPVVKRGEEAWACKM